MYKNKLIAMAVLALCDAALVVYLLPEVKALRPLVMLAFVVAGPGLAIAPFLRLPGLAQQLTLGFSLGLALDISLVLIFLYTGTWSGPRMLAILLVISAGGALLQFLRRDPLPATAYPSPDRRNTNI